MNRLSESGRPNPRATAAPRCRLLRAAASFTFALALVALAPARERDAERWVGTWSASPQATEAPIVQPVPAQFNNQTLRQIVHVSIAGSKLRLRLTNEFGTAPLVIGAVTVARQSTGAGIVPGSERKLSFGGQPSITIPAGAPALSDPVDFATPALGNLAVSIYLPGAVPATTFHALGLSTTYVSPAGDYSAATELPVAATTLSWFFISGVSVAAQPRSAAVVALGDSITDGYASTPDANRRWPNLLAARLQASPAHRQVAVLDHGISGNRTLVDVYGPNALARLDRDVLAAPGAKWVILLEGINNIGLPGAFGLPDQQVTAEAIIAGHQQIVTRAHERGLKIYGGTLTPFEGTTFPGYYSPEGEAKRQAVNKWIRSSGAFDAVIDFDLAVRGPAHPTRLLPTYDCGDHLHPNDAGYQAMADFIDLKLFR